MRFCTACGEKIADGVEIVHQVQSNNPVQGNNNVNQNMPENTGKKKTSKLKWLGIIVGAIIAMFVVMSIFSGSDSSTTNSSNAKNNKAVISIKAEEMLDDYIRDQSSAEKKYKDKNVKITGTVLHKLQFNNSQDYCLVIETKYTGGKTYSIMIAVPVEKVSEINKLKDGDFVNITGECRGIVKQKDPTDITVQIDAKKIN